MQAGKLRNRLPFGAKVIGCKRMKLLPSLMAATALLSPLVMSAANFEGRVTMAMTDKRGTTIPMTISAKAPHTRMDFETPQGAAGMIVDQGKQEVTILMPQQKMYMVQPTPNAAVDEAMKDNTGAPEKTDEHAKIAGYDTTKYVMKTKDGTTDIWVTDQLGTFMGFGTEAMSSFGRRGKRGNSAEDAWEKAFQGKDAFPLRVISTGPSGKQTFKMEATSVEKKSLPDSTFVPPSDFQKLDMSAMGGMGGRPPREK